MSETVPTGGRRVHWLELFFDLVMVAYIGQIAHTMHGDPDWTDALVFAALFATAWWAWVNASVTMNVFGARVTPVMFVAVTLGMVSIGVMAVAVPDALTDRAAAFAIGNAAIRVVWMLPWLLLGRRIGGSWWRPLVYSGVPVALWLASIAVPAPGRYVLWVAAVAVEVIMLSVLGGLWSGLRRALDVDHLVERVSLLVVIVFGESVLSIVAEVDEHWGPDAWAAGALGFVAVAVLAWIFFGYALSSAGRGLRGLQERGSIAGLRDTVMYLPYLLVAGVVLFAAGLGTAVAEAGHELPAGAAGCLAGGVSLFFIASTAESFRYGVPWRDVVLWGPAGIVAPWLLVPLAGVLDATGTVAASLIILVVLAVLNGINVRRMRARSSAPPPVLPAGD